MENVLLVQGGEISSTSLNQLVGTVLPRPLASSFRCQAKMELLRWTLLMLLCSATLFLFLNVGCGKTVLIGF